HTHASLGHFYLDLYPREGKFHYAEAEAPEILKGRVLPQGGYQRPVTAIVVNMPLPAKGIPSLLSLDEVQTFSHEFGHVLHEILTEARYASYSGFLTEMDFSEVLSQLSEYGTLEPQILDEISGHFLNGQKLPAALKAKIIQAQQFQMRLYEMQLLFLSLLDFDYHTVNRRIDIRRAYLDLRQEILKIQSTAGASFPAGFGYLMDPAYAGTHYAYLWSRAIARDFADRFQDAHWDPSMGVFCRKTIFSQGGSRPASLLVDNFLGRPPSSIFFLRDFSYPLQNAVKHLKTVALQKPLNIQTISFTEPELNAMSRRLAGKYVDIFQRNAAILTPEQAFRQAAHSESLPEGLIERILEKDFLTKLQKISGRRLIARNISDHFLRQFRRTLK
ncbi:MAG: hypothetical protein HYY61_04105, partial [Deltaproteobacteria bacterium]|nr:hypothetical protein [Deltaproteobacteria bacterium]